MLPESLVVGVCCWELVRIGGVNARSCDDVAGLSLCMFGLMCKMA